MVDPLLAGSGNGWSLASVAVSVCGRAACNRCSRNGTYNGFSSSRGDRMSELEEIEQRIRSLSQADLAQFRAWFAEFDHALWDRQIEQDSRAGKLDHLAAEAIADYKAGKARDI